MIVIDIKDEAQLIRVLRYFVMIGDMATRQGNLRSIRFGIDPLDNGFKISVDYGVWSPPMTGNIE